MMKTRTLLTRQLAGALLLSLALACSSEQKKPQDSGATITPPPSTVDLDAKYAEARAFENEGNFREAFSRYKEIEGTDPKYRDLAQRLEGYQQLVDLQRDIEDLKDDPPRLRAIDHIQLAQNLRKRGLEYRPLAMAEYQKALDLFPDTFDGHYYMGQLSVESNLYDQAIVHYTRATEIKSNKDSKTALAHFDLAWLHRSTQAANADPKLTLQNAKLAVEYSVGDALEMRRLLANTYFDEGLVEDAIKTAEDIVKRQGSDQKDVQRLERFKGGTPAKAPDDGNVTPPDSGDAPKEGASTEDAPPPADTPPASEPDQPSSEPGDTPPASQPADPDDDNS